MKLVIELCAGKPCRNPTKQDMNKNIAALNRAIKGDQLSNDFVLLGDTKSILEGIKKQLPD